jgi:toxin-antitoxin system PIN domain toxin
MKLFDINILVYAHRADLAHHEFYREALEAMAGGPDAFALSPLVAAGFVRVVTHPSFPNGPTPLAQALAVVDSLTAQPGCCWVMPGLRHWSLTADLCRRCACRGKQVADAQHAALAIEHACTWVTRDTDFGVFTAHGLKLQLLTPEKQAR